MVQKYVPPLISVVIPAYNASRTLVAAIESVLQQDVRPIEIIVVDDASSDGTLELARSFVTRYDFIQVVSQVRNAGPSQSRNLGLGIAQAPYVCFLDADDEYLPGFLNKTMQVLQEDRSVSVVSTAVEIVNLNSSKVIHNLNDAVASSLPSNILVRKEALLLIGGFAVAPFFHRQSTEDVLLRRMLRTYFKNKHVPEKLYKHILYGNNNHLHGVIDTYNNVDNNAEFSQFYYDHTLEHNRVRDSAIQRMQNVIQSSTSIPSFVHWNFTSSIHHAEWQQLSQRYHTIQGYLQPIEGYLLYYWAMNGPGQGVVVEIGSFMGRSTCWLAAGSRAANRGKVVACDHFRGSPEHQVGAVEEVTAIVTHGTTLPQFQANIQRMGLTDWVETRVGSSESVGHLWPRTQPIRLLFIDADHSYETTRLDFITWLPLVEPGGLVAFHDIGVFWGCSQFYNELLQHNPTIEEVGSAGTIRLVRKPFSTIQLSLPEVTESPLALETKKQAAQSKTLRGNWHRANGQLQEAIDCYRQALAIYALDAEALLQLGAIFFAQSQLDQAERYYRMATTVTPVAGATYNNLAMVLEKQGKFEEAIEYYNRAIGQEPQQVFFYLNLAAVHFGQGQLDQAELCYRRALTVTTRSVELWSRLGLVLAKQDRLDEALECFDRAFELHPDHPEPKTYLHTLQGSQQKRLDRIGQMLSYNP
ncbi:MAG: glycosyltransferase [Magnetococcales bacterium]|nr:glycosyltransferase [Magnetococcales bacterium]